MASSCAVSTRSSEATSAADRKAYPVLDRDSTALMAGILPRNSPPHGALNRIRPRAGDSLMDHVKQIQEIRDRARQQITDGAVTQDYQLDRKQVIGILNEALATELVCVLRYKFHY